MLWLDLTLFGIVGFFIDPPVMLPGVTGLDFRSKKAVGAAAVFTDCSDTWARRAREGNRRTHRTLRLECRPMCDSDVYVRRNRPPEPHLEPEAATVADRRSMAAPAGAR
jgi:hypothetical protein